jgi:hypothetical protein
MQLRGCPPVLNAKGLGSVGATWQRAHYCWDGKTKVINDSDCPPQPQAVAPAPIVYAPIPQPAPATPVLTADESMYVPAPVPVVQREAIMPKIAESSVSASSTELIPVSASTGVSVTQAGADDSAADEIAPAPPNTNWLALLAGAAALWMLS